MKVLLINPPYPVCESMTMPLGLLYLAGTLLNAGHEVSLLDIQLSSRPVNALAREINGFDPQVIGVTSFSLNMHVAAKLLKAAKGRSPNALTIWGGPHVSFDDVSVLRRYPWVDCVVRAEGEETINEVVDRWQRKGDLRGIRGITWRSGHGEVIRNPGRAFVSELDCLPQPAWTMLQLSKYLAFGDGASVITSRGCPHRCIFCVGRKMMGPRARLRSVDAVVEEMASLARLGFKRIRIEDDLFTLHRKRAMSMCEQIRARDLGIKWRVYSRVDTVDRELLLQMAQAGCERIMYGVESGHPEILRRARKGITPEQAKRAISMTLEAGIGVLASFVLGLPGEDPQTLRHTVRFAESLGVPYSLNLLTPYLGTEVRKRARDLGIRILTDDWRLYGQGNVVAETSDVSPRQLSMALRRYRSRQTKYVKEVLRMQLNGDLEEEQLEAINRQRRWAFLRELISKEALERAGNGVRAASPMESLDDLAKALGQWIGSPLEEIRHNVLSLWQDGLVEPSTDHTGNIVWKWA